MSAASVAPAPHASIAADPGRAEEGIAGAQRWLLRSALFLLPLAYWPATYDTYVLPKLLLARFLFVGLLILFVARTLASGRVLVKRTPLDLPLLAFVASAAVSTVFAENQNVGVFGTYSRYDGLLTILTYAGLFWLAVQAVADAHEARVVIRTMLVSGYLVAALAILKAVADSLPQQALAHAYGTLGNSNVLGAFLALLCPLAYGELAFAKSPVARLLALNALVMMGAALLLTFSRSAWIGLTVGATVIVVIRPWSRRLAVGVAGIGVAVLFLVAGLLLFGSRVTDGHDFEHAVVDQARTLINPSVLASSRLNIWQDSLTLIASRPVLGYGPDNFGLVYPRFQTGDWGVDVYGVRQQFDKAHSEALQVAATQGLVGLAAYLWVLVAFVVAFWRGRRHPMAVPIFAGWIAYQVTEQFNFSALAAAFPFWVFAAAAVTCLGATERVARFTIERRRVAAPVGLLAIAGLVVSIVPAIVFPYFADADLRIAVHTDIAGAEAPAAQARWLAPQESVYAVEAANLALERTDWATARLDYIEAADLGTFNPIVYFNLALADRALGFTSEGRTAARKAFELDRFDPAIQALVAEFAS